MLSKTVFTGFVVLALFVAVAFSDAAETTKPPRVIALSPSIVEITYAIGAEDSLVGISRFSDYPPEAREAKPSVGGVVDIDVEKVIAIEPDVIISNASVMAEEKLGALGYKLVFLPVRTLDEITASFNAVGEQTGRPDAAGALSERFEGAVAAARERTLRRTPVKVLAVIGYEPLWVAGGAGFLNELFTASGFTNSAGAVEKDFYAASIETILASRPDVIIDLTLEDPQDAAGRKRIEAFWSRFESMPAVRNNRVEFVASDLLTIPGPRLVKGLKALEDIHDSVAPPTEKEAASDGEGES